MKGWFDAFRTDGGPTLYAYSNRTSVTGDVPTITICLVFLTIFLAFIIVFPGVRKERISTFITVTLSMLAGAIICVCNFASHWEVSSAEINTYYRAFSSQKIHATLGVMIGLDHANVTLSAMPKDNSSMDINFNERLFWISTHDLKKHYIQALHKGLPYPILTVAEYLSLDKEGFSWGRHYRTAGYYTSLILWSSLASWLLANILILSVPRYGAYMMIVTGALMGSACATFCTLKPPLPLEMRFEEAVMKFELGWCFWLVLITGAILGLFGLTVSIIDWVYPHKFTTILEVDFDTPYDRHIIIEDSHDTRKRRFKIPRLEEPLNTGLAVGSRLLRRLSKRGKDSPEAEVDTDPSAKGLENPAFEMETPKNVWKSSIMTRSDSKKSTKSVNFRNSSQRSEGFLDLPVLPIETEDKIIFHRGDSKRSCESGACNRSGCEEDVLSHSVPGMIRQDSTQSCASSSSSFGLGLLTRNSSLRKTSDTNKHAAVSRHNSGNIIMFHRTDSRGQLQKANGEVVEIQTDDSAEDW